MGLGRSPIGSPPDLALNFRCSSCRRSRWYSGSSGPLNPPTQTRLEARVCSTQAVKPSAGWRRNLASSWACCAEASSMPDPPSRPSASRKLLLEFCCSQTRAPVYSLTRSVYGLGFFSRLYSSCSLSLFQNGSHFGRLAAASFGTVGLRTTMALAYGWTRSVFVTSFFDSGSSSWYERVWKGLAPLLSFTAGAGSFFSFGRNALEAAMSLCPPTRTA